jgi:hypothetical protein
VLCISLFSGQVKKLRKCSRKNPCCSEMMSCSKWIAEEIEKPGVETLLAEKSSEQLERQNRRSSQKHRCG